MKKTLKIFTIMLMAMVVLSACASMVFAAPVNTGDIISGVNDKIQGDSSAAADLMALAGRVIGLIQIASAVAAIVLVALFGFKFIMGSANEKADYQKSFVPLIVGVIVVFAATSIARLLFGLIGQ